MHKSRQKKIIQSRAGGSLKPQDPAMNEFNAIISQCKQSYLNLSLLNHQERCDIINEIAESLKQNSAQILTANQKDLDSAQAENTPPALLDRLALTSERLQKMIGGMQKVIDLPDPLSHQQSWNHPQGMTITKVKAPIGVLLVVYEARPNVSTDTVALALKTANACILKGSRQTRFTNESIAKATKQVLAQSSAISEAIVFFPDLDHDRASQLISCEHLDLIIPRGGEKLKKIVRSQAQAPILGAGGGLCHLYVSENADLGMASEIIFNAKTQRPSVCNALESVLIHESHLQAEVIEELFLKSTQSGVKVYADRRIKALSSEFEEIEQASWNTEYLDLRLSAKSVVSLNEAIEHINFYGTGHSDVIITEDEDEGKRFQQLVDSACVYVNASSRFTDGEEFGFGAEIGISTQKLHARGPIGPNDLTIYKYLITGDGQVRA